MGESRNSWVPEFRHRSSTDNHSTSVIAFVWEELVVKRYLCAKTAGPLTLEYYLLVSPLVEELEIYGVKIVEKRSGVVAIAPGLTTSGRKILHLIDLLSKGTVTPTSLADIVEDWL